MQQYARDFNCLSDQDRKTRQRALQKLGALARSPQPDVDAAWEQALRVPLLKLFSDTVEKNRELAIGLATELVPVLSPDMLRSSLPYLMPVLVGRLATNPIAEEGEDLAEAASSAFRLTLRMSMVPGRSWSTISAQRWRRWGKLMRRGGNPRAAVGTGPALRQ